MRDRGFGRRFKSDRLLGVDLEQAGVRCVEYRQGDISYFLDVANALGITWHCFTDGDGQGQSDAAKATARLPVGALSRRHLTVLPGGLSIEPYFASNGFLPLFEERASPQKMKSMTAKKGDTDYAEQIAKGLGDKDKPATAHAIVDQMRKLGSTSVPRDLQFAIFKAAALGRRG